jgi:hypothetical protein
LFCNVYGLPVHVVLTPKMWAVADS